MQPHIESDVVISSLFVIADFDTIAGKCIFKQALESLVRLLPPSNNILNFESTLQTEDSQTRITFLHNPPSSSDFETILVSSILAYLISTSKLSRITPDRFASVLGFLVDPIVDGGESNQAPLETNDLFSDLGINSSELLMNDAYDRYVKVSKLAARSFGIKSGETGVVVNGRVSLFTPGLTIQLMQSIQVISSLTKDQFLAADFSALADYEYRKRAAPVVQALAAVKENVYELDK